MCSTAVAPEPYTAEPQPACQGFAGPGLLGCQGPLPGAEARCPSRRGVRPVRAGEEEE